MPDPIERSADMATHIHETTTKAGMDTRWPARGLIALGFVLVMVWVALSWQSLAPLIGRSSGKPPSGASLSIATVQVAAR
jgi:hypothetical protein